MRYLKGSATGGACRKVVSSSAAREGLEPLAVSNDKSGMAETLDPVLPPEVQDRANRVLELACEKERYLASSE